VLLLCYHYDPSTGKYGATALGMVRIGAVATILAFLVFLVVSLRRERAAAMAQPDVTPHAH
jgi:protein SCO1/2